MGQIEIFLEGTMSFAQNEAIAAAQAGDWSKADALELAYLNTHKRKLFDADSFPPSEWMWLRATKLYRGLAPGGQIAVRWITVSQRAFDEGDYTEDDVFFTDIDGNRIELPEKYHYD